MLGYSSALSESFKPRPHMKKYLPVKTELMWVMGYGPLQEEETGRFLFLSSPRERDGPVVLCSFVTGVEEKIVELVRLCLFQVLIGKEMIKWPLLDLVKENICLFRGSRWLQSKSMERGWQFQLWPYSMLPYGWALSHTWSQPALHENEIEMKNLIHEQLL